MHVLTRGTGLYIRVIDEPGELVERVACHFLAAPGNGHAVDSGRRVGGEEYRYLRAGSAHGACLSAYVVILEQLQLKLARRHVAIGEHLGSYTLEVRAGASLACGGESGRRVEILAFGGPAERKACVLHRNYVALGANESNRARGVLHVHAGIDELISGYAHVIVLDMVAHQFRAVGYHVALCVGKLERLVNILGADSKASHHQ